MFKIAAFVSGGGTNLQNIIDAIEDGRLENTEIAVVISTNHHCKALARAKKYGIPSAVFAKKDFESARKREETLISCLRQYDVHLAVMCGCLMIFSAEFISSFGYPIINIHPALLPEFGGRGYYGLAVHEAVLAAGKEISGATVHYVDGGIDTGEIILQKEVLVKKDDTAESLQRRVMEEAEAQILLKAISMFAERRLNL